MAIQKPVSRETPSNVPAEQVYLGSILLEPDTIFISPLEAREFYIEKHRWIFEAMQACLTPDFLGVVSKLGERGKLEQVGGAAYLTRLLGAVTTASGAPNAADLIHREYVKRRVIEQATYAVEDMFNAEGVETNDLIAIASSRFAQIDVVTDGNLVQIGEAAGELIEEINSGETDEADKPIPTEFDLDKYVKGLKRGQFWLVGGIPGSGKTALATQLAASVARRGHRTVIFSLEMTRKELVARLASTLTGISNETIERKTYTEEERERIMDALSELSRSPLFIDDSPSQTSHTIWARCRAMKAQGIPPRFMICDYSRLLLDTAASEDIRTNNITRVFKLLARELDGTSMLIHWLNAQDKFKYGGTYDPDVAIVCDKEEGKRFFRLEKNRNGDTPDVEMFFDGSLYRWANPTKAQKAQALKKFVMGPPVSFDREGLEKHPFGIGQ